MERDSERQWRWTDGRVQGKWLEKKPGGRRKRPEVFEHSRSVSHFENVLTGTPRMFWNRNSENVLEPEPRERSGTGTSWNPTSSLRVEFSVASHRRMRIVACCPSPSSCIGLLNLLRSTTNVYRCCRPPSGTFEAASRLASTFFSAAPWPGRVDLTSIPSFISSRCPRSPTTSPVLSALSPFPILLAHRLQIVPHAGRFVLFALYSNGSVCLFVAIDYSARGDCTNAR